MTEKEIKEVKDIIETTVKSLIGTIKLNFNFSDESKEYLNKVAEEEIKYGKDDVDRLDPNYWNDINKANTFYVEWNGHHPS